MQGTRQVDPRINSAAEFWHSVRSIFVKIWLYRVEVEIEVEIQVETGPLVAAAAAIHLFDAVLVRTSTSLELIWQSGCAPGWAGRGWSRTEYPLHSFQCFSMRMNSSAEASRPSRLPFTIHPCISPLCPIRKENTSDCVALLHREFSLWIWMSSSHTSSLCGIFSFLQIRL